MDLDLFRTLQTVLRAYSRQSPKFLIDHYLRIRIIIKINLSSIQQGLRDLGCPTSEQAVFQHKSKQTRLKQFVCVAIDHPLGLPLTSLLLKNIDGCIVLNEGCYSSNIISMPKIQDSRPTRGILLKTQLPSFDQLSQALDAYLSVCEVFMAHVHLVVSCYEAETEANILKEINPVEGDQFIDFHEGGYFRVLEERGNRVTLSQLSEMCRVERMAWGAMLVFEGGQEGLIVWITQHNLPLLGAVPLVGLGKKHTRMMPVFLQNQLGLKIFKKKEVWKEKMEEVETTTIIFNVREYTQPVRFQISQLFMAQSNAFFSKSFLERDTINLQQNIKHCTRICQILDMPLVPLLKRLMKN